MSLNHSFIAAAIIWLLLAPISRSQPIAPKFADYETYLDYIGAYEAYRLELKRYNEIQTELAAEEAALWSKDVYNIDSLRITVKTRDEAGRCVTGGHHIIELRGVIGPDSSFAMERLLSKNKSCYDEMGRLLYPVSISLASSGGLLSDGYALGQTLRNSNARVSIKNHNLCASSCAVAFLGGVRRHVEDSGSIVFHAPYFSGRNEYGKIDVDCDVGDEALAELRAYYQKMTDDETGERLFERTMWYCSADDGWIVTGGAAAELYGIATER